MNKSYKLLVAIVPLLTLYVTARSQNYTTLLSAGDTPQLNALNPALAPQHSFITLPLLGNLDAMVTSPFSYNSLVDNSNKLTLDKIKYDSRFNTSLSLDVINIGVRIADKKHFVTFSIKPRLYSIFTYPSGAFDMIINNSIDQFKEFNINLSNSALLWVENALGYTHTINDNWSVGVKAKFLMGLFSGNTQSTNLVFDKTVNGYAISGDVDLRLGGLDSDERFAPSLSNNGFAADIGVAYRSDDNRLNVGASVLDIGYINWSSGGSQSIVASNPSFEHIFNGLGDLQEAFSQGDINGLVKDIYTDILDALDLKTANEGYKDLLPITLHMGVRYSLDDKLQHTFSANLMNYIYPTNNYYDYSITTGYTYSSKDDRFRAIASITNRQYNPLSLGLGVVANLGVFQLLIMSDMNINGLAGLGYMQSIGFRFGINILMGRRVYKHKNKPDKFKPNEFIEQKISELLFY